MTLLPYDLARELKEAGWPQIQEKSGGAWLFGKDAMQNQIYSPSLSELIEACGEGFDELYRVHHTGLFGVSGGYLTVTKTVRHKTPEEAVAHL